MPRIGERYASELTWREELGLESVAENNRAATHEPPPIVREGAPAIQDLVVIDIQARKEVGLKKYGAVLQAHNGRDALMDAYQEALDLVMYLRQVIEERTCTPPAARP